MKPVFSVLLAGLVVACATAENQSPFDNGGDTAGSSGTGTDVAGTTASTSGSSSGGSGNNGGTPPASGGQPTGGTGTQNIGGMITAGTGFGTGGTATGGTGSGGTGTGGTGTGGTATGGAGGKAAGGTGTGGGGGAGGKATGGTGGTGTAGTGGTGNQVGCGPKTGWTAKAMPDHSTTNCTGPDDTNPYCGPPARGIDGVTTNRYTSVEARAGTEWFQIDFGKSVSVSKVVVNTAAGSSDYTLSYEVKMAATEAGFTAAPVITMGAGMMGATTITFPAAQTGQFLRVYQKTAMAGWWSIAEIDVTCP